jgi:acetyl-CoA acyltransferase
MARQIEEAYVVATARTAVAKRRGAFRVERPDNLLAHVIRGILAQVPSLDAGEIGDVITGCANPEAEQGLNVSRVGALLAGLPARVPAYTVSRLCSSGLQTVALAADRIRLGEADVMLACGTESMSIMPTLSGNKMLVNPSWLTSKRTETVAYSMGLTAERVAEGWQVSREAQDAFAAESHRRALAAIAAGHFRDEILPYTVREYLPGTDGTARVAERVVDTDEGPRPGTSIETLAKLKPIFAAGGTVTAGNSSQMSDGAGAVLLMSTAGLKRYGLKPIARFMSYAVAGVEPDVMGIGPIEAIPRALKQAGIGLQDVDWIELNEAFAAQAVAVIDVLKLDPARVNPLGGAIALGHPLGATGAIRTATIMNAMRRGAAKCGMVTMCIGTGMGAAGIFERL